MPPTANRILATAVGVMRLADAVGQTRIQTIGSKRVSATCSHFAVALTVVVAVGRVLAWLGEGDRDVLVLAALFDR